MFVNICAANNEETNFIKYTLQDIKRDRPKYNDSR